MKLWKWIKKCPMLFLLAGSWTILGAHTWLEGKITLSSNLVENPAFTALLRHETELPDLEGKSFMPDDSTETDTEEDRTVTYWAGGRDEEDHAKADSQNEAGGPKAGCRNEADHAKADSQNEAGGSKAGGRNEAGITKDRTNDQAGKERAGEKETPAGITKFVEYQKTETDSPYYTDPGKKALTTEYDYQSVDKSYFDDAVFIGDSRTVGMQDYSGLDNAAFFAKNGLNVYELLEKSFITDPESGREVSIPYMLKKYKYGKVYVMIGINELGTGNTGTFQKAYRGVIRKIHKWQPDAVIYIQGIIPVSQKKNAEDDIFNNININDKNVATAQLADGKDIFYLDISSKLTDKDGYLKENYTFDDVHMYAQYYKFWTKYLMKHAVVRT